MSGLSSSLLCTLSSILINLGLGLAISQPTFVGFYCSKYYYDTNDVPFAANLNLLLSSLSSNASLSSNNGLYYSTTGHNQDKIYGSFLCRGDVTHKTCQNCVETAVEEIKQRCPVDRQAILFYEKCMLRYSYFPIFSVLDRSPRVYSSESKNVTDAKGFSQTLADLMDNLATWAASSGSSSRILYFATREANFTRFHKIYGLLQCTPDLPRDDCDSCLREAIGEIPFKFNVTSGRSVYFPSCAVRYSDSPFYKLNSSASAPPLTGKRTSSAPPSTGRRTSSAPPLTGKRTSSAPPLTGKRTSTSTEKRSSTRTGRNSFQTILVIAIAVVITVILFPTIFFFIQRRKVAYISPSQDPAVVGASCTGYALFLQRRKRKSKEFVLDKIMHEATLQFDFGTIKAATDNFSDINKLGVGGFGAVYKGRLSNGQEVAVKRLSRNSTQGEVEFENEVTLVAKLQDRNFVRLLGFCLEGKQLIYEFVPNKSFDDFLFDPIKRADLDWEKRYKIIDGIARGLLYLHEDSLFKIIHRDLKPSNILLDAKMSPKISDFGLAKVVVMGQTRENTNGIAGTRGYMAPEYAIKGQFSVKSDVYSFGVILLEILSGKRVNSFYHWEYAQNLLGYAWRLWHEGNCLEFINPLIRDSCPTTEVLKCLLIGLLCVQGDAECRPTMSSVISMLKETLNTLHLPRQPVVSVGKTSLQANQTPLSPKFPSVNEVTLSSFSP